MRFVYKLLELRLRNILNGPGAAGAHDDLHSQHTPEAIRERLHLGPQHSYLRDFIYGAIDGAVTTFAVVSGVAGAALSPGIVVILGLANLVGDGFSMAVSNFLGTRAEEQLRMKARRDEEMHIATVPDGEREEIRQIFAAKGLQGDDLERVVDVITADEGQWVDTMMREELGLTLDGPSALKAALMTFVSFIFVGAIPLLAFLLEVFTPLSVEQPFLWSAILTGGAFFIVGALKSKFVDQRWYLAGIETLLMGGVAASLAYLVGYLLKGLVDVV